MDLNTNERSNVPQIVPLEFYDEFEPDGNGGLKAVEYVKWQKKGVSTPAITIEKIARLKPREARNGRPARAAAPEWQILEPYYNAYKKGIEPPEDGTALGAWPGCPRGLAKALQSFSVRSVEDFVGMPDGQRDKINYPGVRALVKQAELFLKNKELEHNVHAVTEDLKAENAELLNMVKELQDSLEQLTAPSAQEGEEAPKRRGRPPKKGDE